MLRRNGYANANITDILAEAGLGTRAFYRHFATKDDLLVALFRDNAEVTRAAVAAQVAGAGSPPARVLAWIDALLDLGYDERHRELAGIFTSAAVGAVIADAGGAVIEALRAPLAEAIVDGAADGSLTSPDPVADAATVHAIVWPLVLTAIAGSGTLDRGGARAQVLRFVGPALGIHR